MLGCCGCHLLMMMMMTMMLMMMIFDDQNPASDYRTKKLARMGHAKRYDHHSVSGEETMKIERSCRLITQMTFSQTCIAFEKRRESAPLENALERTQLNTGSSGHHQENRICE